MDYKTNKYGINFDDLNRTLIAYTRGLLPQLLPRGKFEGHEYVALNPKRFDRKLGSFRINCRTMVWCDFATNDKGKGFISLYCYLNEVKPLQAALDLTSTVNIALPENFQNEHDEPSAFLKHKNQTQLIERIWQNANNAYGSVVQKYLTKRNIGEYIPASIRYLPNHSHKITGSNWPCMLSAITIWPQTKATALHRTYLRSDGSGKAPIEPNKMMLGKASGGAVVVAKSTDQLILSEGIETALSTHKLVNQNMQYGIWAVLSASGYVNLVLPPLPFAATIIIAADNDLAGVKAARQAAEKWTKAGRKVKIALPPVNQDFNDLLMDDTSSTSRVERKMSGEVAQRTLVREHNRIPKFDVSNLEVQGVDLWK